MGWTAKIISTFLLLALLCPSIISASNDCDLEITNATIAVDASDEVVYMNVKNFNSLKNITNFCSWNITFPIGQAFLDLSHIVLDSKDTLVVGGFHADNVTFDSLFNGNGTIPTGLISAGSYNYLMINLSLSNIASPSRTYSTAFYGKGNVQLNRENGLMAFPLNDDVNSTINSKFTLLPHKDYFDRVILLNFTHFPADRSILINDKPYNGTNLPSAFLQDTSPLKIEFKDYKPAEPIVVSYSLVSSNCSQVFNLAKVGDKQAILVPNEAYRSQQQLTSIKCAQIFNGPKDTKFQLQIDPKQDGLANSGDLINVYDSAGAIEISLNGPALMYFRTIENYLNGNQYLVVYESPFVANTNPKYIPPVMNVISKDDAAVYMLTNGDLPVTLPDKANQIVHLLYPTDLTSTSKQVVIDFGSAKITAGAMNITIYSSEDASAQPLVQLGSSSSLPSLIATGAPISRIVYSGKIQALKVVYRLVDIKTSCQSVSTWNPNFEVKGGQTGVCSWFVPATNANTTVIDPTVLRIPKGKSLSVTSFGATAKTVSYDGPIDEYYFPDMFWDNSISYEFSIDPTNTTVEDFHLLLVKKNNYINEKIKVESDTKVSTIKSTNYPGYYPVGYTQYWMFVQDPKQNNSVFFTIEDIHLKDNHKLTLLNKKDTISWTGDANLTSVPDYLISSPASFSLYLDSTNYNLTSFSNRGFRVNLQYPGIAQAITATKKEQEIVFASKDKVASNPLNIWQISADDKSNSLSDSILYINVSLADTLDKTKAKLSIYDSISLREQTIHLANGSINGLKGYFVGSIKSAIIVYDYSGSLDTKADFSVNLTVRYDICNHTKEYSVSKCHTVDRCITDMMICNQINECGDYTDELYCNGSHPAPPAPTPVSGGGVNTLVVIFVLMPLSAILGILGYIYLPQFLLRIRRGRYSEFRDLSEVS